MLLHYLGKAEQAHCVEINRIPEKNIADIIVITWTKISTF